jgi:hypothetical protein
MERESFRNSSHSGHNSIPLQEQGYIMDAEVTAVTTATSNVSAPAEQKKGMKGLFRGNKLTAEERREAQRMKFADYE